MSVTNIFSFLVHPSKGEEEQPEIKGVEIRLEGKLFEMLKKQFELSTTECNTSISFKPSHKGEQKNECRDKILSVIKSPQLENARVLANLLQSVTTHRSGLGLLFISLGNYDSLQRICLSRYPADFGIVAEETGPDLQVDYLEKVFMKNMSSYKAAVYEGRSFDSDFWIGKAIDKQINNDIVAISGYWIKEFLQSDFKTTDANGTWRLAKALQGAIDSTDDIQMKNDLIAVATITKNFNGQVISVHSLLKDELRVSQDAYNAIVGQMKSPELRFDKFQFKTSEFKKHVKYRSMSISNGVMLTAPYDDFDKRITITPAINNPGMSEFKTVGTIVNDKLQKSSR